MKRTIMMYFGLSIIACLLILSCGLFEKLPDIIQQPIITPTLKPTPIPYCHVNDISCVDMMFQVERGGGLYIESVIDLDREYIIEFVVTGGVGSTNKGFFLSGKSADDLVFFSLQKVNYVNYGNNLFRGYYAIGTNSTNANNYASNIISAEAFGCPYSMTSWKTEDHVIRLHFIRGQYRIEVDNDYQSVWGGREVSTLGIKTMQIMFGNSVDPGERFMNIETAYKQLRIYYVK